MFTFYAKTRDKNGKSASRRLRIQNKFPGIIYGNKKPSLYIALNHNEIINAQLNSNFYKNILIIIINNKKYEVKFQAIQRHPYKLKILHIDFLYYSKITNF